MKTWKENEAKKSRSRAQPRSSNKKENLKDRCNQSKRGSPLPLPQWEKEFLPIQGRGEEGRGPGKGRKKYLGPCKKPKNLSISKITISREKFPRHDGAIFHPNREEQKSTTKWEARKEPSGRAEWGRTPESKPATILTGTIERSTKPWPQCQKINLMFSIRRELPRVKTALPAGSGKCNTKGK